MSDPKLRNFHEAKWDEPVIFEQSVPGSRSILFPDVSQKAMPVTGDVSDLIPDHLKDRKVLHCQKWPSHRYCVIISGCPRRPSARILILISVWVPVL